MLGLLVLSLGLLSSVFCVENSTETPDMLTSTRAADEVKPVVVAVPVPLPTNIVGPAGIFQVNPATGSLNSLGMNGITTVNGNMVTVMNTSGIFTFPLKPARDAAKNETDKEEKKMPESDSTVRDVPMNETVKEEKTMVESTKKVVRDLFGDSFSTGLNSWINNVMAQSGVNMMKPGEIVTSSNGMYTVLNATGTFMGPSMDKLKKVESTGGVNISNVPPGTSVSVTTTNGNTVITLTNSTGTFVGKTMETLTKL